MTPPTTDAELELLQAAQDLQEKAEALNVHLRAQLAGCASWPHVEAHVELMTELAQERSQVFWGKLRGAWTVGWSFRHATNARPVMEMPLTSAPLAIRIQVLQGHMIDLLRGRILDRASEITEQLDTVLGQTRRAP
jgi:hypothetical protein